VTALCFDRIRWYTTHDAGSEFALELQNHLPVALHRTTQAGLWIPQNAQACSGSTPMPSSSSSTSGRPHSPASIPGAAECAGIVRSLPGRPTRG